MPDIMPPISETTTQPTSSPPAAPPSPPSSGAAPETSAPLPTQDAGTRGQAPAGVTPSPAQPTLRDRLASLGLPVQGDTEDAILQGLAGQYRQLNELAPYGREYVQMAPQLTEFQKWQAEQAKAKEPAAPKQEWWEELGWKPPVEFDPSWRNQLQVGADGQVQGPPGLVAKYQEWQAWRDRQLGQLADNPYKFMQPAIERLAKEQAEAIVQSKLKELEDRTWASGYLDKTGWLYQFDDKGQKMLDATGRALPSPLGQKFFQYAEDAARQGVRDVRLQQKYAENQVYRDYTQELFAKAAGGDEAARAQLLQLMGTQQPTAPATPAAPQAPNGGPPPQSPLEKANEEILKAQGQKAKAPPKSRLEPAAPPASTFSELYYQEKVKNGAAGAPALPQRYPGFSG